MSSDSAGGVPRTLLWFLIRAAFPSAMVDGLLDAWVHPATPFGLRVAFLTGAAALFPGATVLDLEAPLPSLRIRPGATLER